MSSDLSLEPTSVLYPIAEEARITCAIVDTAARVRDLNFKDSNRLDGHELETYYPPHAHVLVHTSPMDRRMDRPRRVAG